MQGKIMNTLTRGTRCCGLLKPSKHKLMCRVAVLGFWRKRLTGEVGGSQMWHGKWNMNTVEITEMEWKFIYYTTDGKIIALLPHLHNEGFTTPCKMILEKKTSFAAYTELRGRQSNKFGPPSHMQNVTKWIMTKYLIINILSWK